MKKSLAMKSLMISSLKRRNVVPAAVVKKRINNKM